MRYCRFCRAYKAGCPHLDRRLTPRQSPWEVRVVYALIVGVLAYVAGGVWGLW